MSTDAPVQRIHFSLPPGLERFVRFKDLPYDIRHKIWEQLIYSPGIHFLKFERNFPLILPLDDSSSSEEDTTSDDGSTGPSGSQNPRRQDLSKTRPKIPKTFTATLKPIFPLPAADLSYHIQKTKTLTQISLSCNEGAYEVNRIISRPDNLTLDNGRLISFANSSDIVCIDYPDIFSTRGLGSWAQSLDTSQLNNVRRLAVRYHPDWDKKYHFCRICGRYHQWLPSPRKEQVPRRHLYQFATLFPRLETFYLLDHLIVRQPPGIDVEEDSRWLGPSDRARLMAEFAASDNNEKRGERFQSGTGRVYYEVDRNNCNECKVHSHVFNMLEWVQENYVEMCEKKPRGKHQDPKSVKFAVLACEWETTKLVADKIEQPEKTPTRAQNHKRKRARKQKRIFSQEVSELEQDMGSLKLETNQNSLPVVFGDHGQSSYLFSFRTRVSFLSQ
ncbi:hypothetical protein PFICI_03050 [Pestalotiopsis fici W106-1]|uniref:Uncharacterized protein n=1 Tax=Pestalotiopsis fici (strain W106-1 / CGMCC3.15140) TaxID=1229662 RepID=W3XG66_PESFW|nr:uncharacterized protein PFICI_03050 [Pestalotiopsis fici W106-1]ETS85025.1 hypothetical protein PFICI_03050 [Pestalotiopsis fici W106-1]